MIYRNSCNRLNGPTLLAEPCWLFDEIRQPKTLLDAELVKLVTNSEKYQLRFFNGRWSSCVHARNFVEWERQHSLTSGPFHFYEEETEIGENFIWEYDARTR